MAQCKFRFHVISYHHTGKAAVKKLDIPFEVGDYAPSNGDDIVYENISYKVVSRNYNYDAVGPIITIQLLKNY